MKRYKLKESVKEKLIIMGLIAIGILSLTITTKLGEDAYNDCMSKHNDNNFCHRLMES